MRSHSLASAVVVLMLARAAPAQLIQNFGGGGTPFTIGAYVGPPPTTMANGPPGATTYLRMTPPLNDRNAALYFDLVNPGTHTAISGSFDFRIFNGSSPPADGFGFLLLPTSVYGSSGVPPTLPTSLGAVAWERPIGGGDNPVNPSFASVVAFSANIFFGGPSSTGVWYDNAQVGSFQPTPSPYNLYKGEGGTDNGTAFDRADFIFDFVDGTFSLTITQNTTGTLFTIYDDLSIPGLSPAEFRLGIGGRTGGLFQTLDFTNFNVTFTVVPEPSSLALLGVMAFGTWRTWRRAARRHVVPVADCPDIAIG